MSRLTPFAVQQLQRVEPKRAPRPRGTAAQRVARIRQDEIILTERVMRDTDRMMRGRYGVRF